MLFRSIVALKYRRNSVELARRAASPCRRSRCQRWMSRPELRRLRQRARPSPPASLVHMHWNWHKRSARRLLMPCRHSASRRCELRHRPARLLARMPRTSRACISDTLRLACSACYSSTDDGVLNVCSSSLNKLKALPEQRRSAFLAKSLRSSRQFEIRLSSNFKFGEIGHVLSSSSDADSSDDEEYVVRDASSSST